MGEICVLINLLSGALRGQRLRRELESSRRFRSGDLKIFEIGGDADESQLEQAKSFKIVLVAGGDGSVGSIFPRFLGTACKLGVIPLGTGNDMARELGWSGILRVSGPDDLLAAFEGANTALLTVWQAEVTGRSDKIYFTNYLSFGFDAKVVKRLHAWRRSLRMGRFGRWGIRLLYAAAIVRQLASFLGTISIEGRSGSGDLSKLVLTHSRSIIVGNIRSVMGLGMLTQKGDPFDCRMELIQIRSVWNYLAMCLPPALPFLRARLLGGFQSLRITGLRSTDVWQIDGDPCDFCANEIAVSSAGTVQVLLGPAPPPQQG